MGSGDINDYFDLFRYHGLCLDEADIKEMRRLTLDEAVNFCPHCFRPYILFDKTSIYYRDSNRHSRFQIMLEIISFYVFIIICWVPMAILMIFPAIIMYVYSQCKGFTKPKAFTRDDVLADIQLQQLHPDNSKHVSNVIRQTIKEKKKQGDFEYMQISAPLAGDEADAGANLSQNQ